MQTSAARTSAKATLQLAETFRQFQIHGQLVRAQPLTTGHINETWLATYELTGTRVRFLHQRINRQVFKNPGAVMDNLARVTSHIHKKLERRGVPDPARRCLTIVSARDGRAWVRDQHGEYWRAFLFLEGLRAGRFVSSPRDAFEAGRAFGQFMSDLSDLPGRRLIETIPHFHDTRRRFKALLKAVAADSRNRAAACRAEIEFALKREAFLDSVLNGLAKGRIPERITHNDAKFNNLMLDAKTGQAMCVVDLDTVMPGCALYDFGDLIRTATCSAREHERDLAKVNMQMPLFRKLAQGYLSAAGRTLNRTEKSLLAFSGKLITFETGIRFLTDHLNGDTYFRIHRPRQNLDRCRTQFKLVESIERQEDAMQACVERSV